MSSKFGTDAGFNVFERKIMWWERSKEDITSDIETIIEGTQPEEELKLSSSQLLMVRRLAFTSYDIGNKEIKEIEQRVWPSDGVVYELLLQCMNNIKLTPLTKNDKFFKVVGNTNYTGSVRQFCFVLWFRARYALRSDLYEYLSFYLDNVRNELAQIYAIQEDLKAIESFLNDKGDLQSMLLEDVLDKADAPNRKELNILYDVSKNLTGYALQVYEQIIDNDQMTFGVYEDMHSGQLYQYFDNALYIGWEALPEKEDTIKTALKCLSKVPQGTITEAKRAKLLTRTRYLLNSANYVTSTDDDISDVVLDRYDLYIEKRMGKNIDSEDNKLYRFGRLSTPRDTDALIAMNEDTEHTWGRGSLLFELRHYNRKTINKPNSNKEAKNSDLAYFKDEKKKPSEYAKYIEHIKKWDSKVTDKILIKLDQLLFPDDDPNKHMDDFEVAYPNSTYDGMEIPNDLSAWNKPMLPRINYNPNKARGIYETTESGINKADPPVNDIERASFAYVGKEVIYNGKKWRITGVKDEKIDWETVNTYITEYDAHLMNPLYTEYSEKLQASVKAFVKDRKPEECQALVFYLLGYATVGKPEDGWNYQLEDKPMYSSRVVHVKKYVFAMYTLYEGLLFNVYEEFTISQESLNSLKVPDDAGPVFFNAELYEALPHEDEDKFILKRYGEKRDVLKRNKALRGFWWDNESSTNTTTKDFWQEFESRRALVEYWHTCYIMLLDIVETCLGKDRDILNKYKQKYINDVVEELLVSDKENASVDLQYKKSKMFQYYNSKKRLKIHASKNKYQIIPIRYNMPEKYQEELDEFILFAIMTRMKEANQDVETNLESLTTYLVNNNLLSKEAKIHHVNTLKEIQAMKEKNQQKKQATGKPAYLLDRDR